MYTSWCETGVDLGVPGRIVDRGVLLSTRQVIDLIHGIGQPLVAADIVEYNPRCDVSSLTAIVAAKLLREVGGVMVRNQVKAAI